MRRGFVNGALAVVCESLLGNGIFTAKLVGTGNMVLVHPIVENGCRFVPCCYGYATTIRRAQGADLVHGYVYFEQKRWPAARGYGYVACSRFKTRAGCYLYGKLRCTDFLPVGGIPEEEQLERRYYPLDSDASDGEDACVGVEEAAEYVDEIVNDVNDGCVLADFA